MSFTPPYPEYSSLRPVPDWPFGDQEYTGLIASYQDALRSGNLTAEASLKDILLQARLTAEELEVIQRETIADMTFIIFYRQSWYYRIPICETTDREHMFRVIQGNIHEPFKYSGKGKRSKKAKELPDLDLNHWGTPKKKVKPVAARVSQAHHHPDGVDLVNLAKSAAIHYALPGKKKTLCGKPWDRPVKDEHKLDTLYPICPKCQTKT